MSTPSTPTAADAEQHQRDGTDPPLSGSGATPPEPIYDVAVRELSETWNHARAELGAKRAARDALNDEIRALARDEDLLRQAYSVFAKEANKRGAIDTENSR